MSFIELAGGLLFGFGGWLVALYQWARRGHAESELRESHRSEKWLAALVAHWVRRAQTAEEITAAMHAAEEWTE